MIEYSKVRTSFPVVTDSKYISFGGNKIDGYIQKDKEKIFKISPDLKKVYELLLKMDPIGRIGNYKGVFHLYNAIEVYTPDIGANPGKEGEIGKTEFTNILMFETFFDSKKVSEDKILEFIEKLANIHPRETPVIELITNDGIKIFG